jgi:autophagy-related protein 5
MQSQIWESNIPLHITHPSSSIPYLVQVPRLSYLPLLLPRLTSFFGSASSFSHEGILLKNLPVGLLCDLYQPELPWRLVLGDGPLFDIHDTFINSVKEVGDWRMLVLVTTIRCLLACIPDVLWTL